MTSDQEYLILEVAKKCSDLVTSYLNIDHNSAIISDTKKKIEETIKVFEEQILTKWSPFCDDESGKNFLSISYNGGKDCQVLLILYLACLYRKYSHHLKSTRINRIPAVYLKTYDNFGKLIDFIEKSSLEYQLALYTTKASNMESSLMEYLLSLKLEHQEETGILLGTRSTDAINYKMTTVQPTDKNYPKFIRLQPILNWKLSNIWSFLIFTDEPHCELYDYGYTSLGKPCETVPNPWLLYTPENENIHNSEAFDFEFSNCKQNKKILNHKDGYLPGWYLLDDSKERDGRVCRLKSRE